MAVLLHFTLAPEASVIEPPERHGIESVVRRVVDHYAPDLQVLCNPECGLKVVSEYALLCNCKSELSPLKWSRHVHPLHTTNIYWRIVNKNDVVLE